MNGPKNSSHCVGRRLELPGLSEIAGRVGFDELMNLRGGREGF